MALIRDQKLDGLALSSLKRDDALLEIPTTLEAGYPNSEYTFANCPGTSFWNAVASS